MFESKQLLPIIVGALITVSPPVLAEPDAAGLQASRMTGANQFRGSRVTHVTSDGRTFRERACCSVQDNGATSYHYAVRKVEREVADGDDKKTVYHYYFEYTVRNRDNPIVRSLGDWSSEDEGAVEWIPKSVQLSEAGVPYAVVYKKEGAGLARKSRLLLFRGGEVQREWTAPGHARLGVVRLLLDENDEPIVIGRRGKKIELLYQGQRQTLLEKSDYDWSVARDAKGYVYLLAYDYSNRSLMMTFSSGDLQEWKLRMVDSAEAGWHHALSMWNDQLVVAYYYYRNAFNKGLNLATIEKGEIINRRFHRERNGNAGWEPSVVIDHGGKVTLSYLGNVSEKRRATHRFGSVDKLFAQEEPEYAGAWEDHYRNWLIVAGADTAFQWWHVWAPGPWNSGAIDADYDYKPGLLLTAFSEARIGSLNLGLSYTSNLLADVVESNAGVGARRAFEVLNGFVGYDDLVWGHDVRVAVSRAKLEGVYTDDNNPGSSRSLKSELYEFDIGLLNQMRLRYGLTFRHYNLMQPVYVYYAPEGSEDYVFRGSDTVGSKVYRAALYLNYSKLDYLSKYETEFSGFDIGGTLAIGLGLSTWTQRTIGGYDTSGTIQPAGRIGIHLGYLLYKRFYAAHGIGLFMKAGYRFQADAHGFSAGTPGDRDDDDLDSSQYEVKAVHYQFEQGPFLNFGFVY